MRGVDVIVQSADELWEQKWDELHGGIKYYIKRSNGDAHTDAEFVKYMINK